jgi:hypothetical protein
MRQDHLGDLDINERIILKRILYNFTVNATYLFEYFALYVSTIKGRLQVLQIMYKKKLRGFSPLANYTDRTIAVGQRS